MGYLKTMYGYRDDNFIKGFLAAMDTYAIWHSGQQWIGSPERKLKDEMRSIVSELGGDTKVLRRYNAS